ncbi:hypothetical protein U5640_16970 [Streptomyces sp. SS7]|uniref:hypothetical protein n=1 Tax=Streptomyces sp. SS7 TaxID=3108485 RepID=UPI0030EDFBD9
MLKLWIQVSVLDEEHSVWHEVDTVLGDEAGTLAQDWMARGLQVRSRVVPSRPAVYLSTYQHQIENPATCVLDLV